MSQSGRSLGRVLLWIGLIVAALIVLAVFFGGFKSGSRSAGLGTPRGGPLVSTHAARLAG